MQRLTDLERIQRVSAALAWACGAFAVALPVCVLILWAMADASTLASRGNLAANAIWGNLQPWQRAVGALVSEMPAMLAALGLWHARRCFAGFARSEVFTARAVQCLRRFSACVAGSALAAVVAGPLLSVVLTWGNPPGLRHLALGVGSDHLFTTLFAAVVWLMAAVIGQGRALADENASFV
ncbi:MAG: DUF2975 domain-containing protein [Ramlibacter sp.]|nr:DUF2975 domain-containing protein [Ramlibacter sp.]